MPLLFKNIQMKKYLLFTFCSVFFCQYALAQSGWTREKNNYFIKADYTFYNATDYHNINGDVLKTSRFKQNTIALYGEYGISKRFAASAYLPLFRQNGYETTETVNGTGDLKLELKYALVKGKFPVAVSVAPELPTGPKNLYAKNISNPLDKINLPTGDGEFNVWTTVAASHSFYPVPLYTSVYSAFNWRTKFGDRNFQNQFQAGIEAGYKIKNKFWLNAKLLALTGVGQKPQFADFIRSDGTAYTAVTLGGLYEIGNHWGITGQYFRCNSLIAKATNIYAANIFSFGLTYNKMR
jgi:hypothetical protein